MDFFKRIGTDRHKFKIQFFLKTLQLNTKKLKGEIYVKIKRGDHKVSSQKKISLDDDGSCNFGRQILTFQALTLFYDKDNNNYLEKQGQISIILVTKTGDKKLLGSFQIDVAQYANSKKQNIEVEKQFGDKLKGIFKYDIFIKYLGQASQTSKSTDKKIQPKRQSSLSKFTNIFTGIKNQQKKKDDQDNSPDQKKKVNRKEQNRQKSNPKKNLKQQEKPTNKKQPSKNTSVTQDVKPAKNLVKRSQLTGTQKKADKAKNKKKDSEQEEEDDQSFQEFRKQKQKKNLVNIKEKKDNLTQVEESQKNNKAKGNKRGSAPQEQKVFFDQGYNKKNNNQQDNSVQQDPKPNKMKRTQNPKPVYQAKQPQKKETGKKINQFTLKNDINQQIQKQLNELKDKNNKLVKENKEFKSENQKLKQLNQMMNQKLENFLNDRDNNFFQTQRQGPNKGKVDDERVKNLQKQKGDLLVKVQKLEQKYKKDFKKYEERVEQYQEQKKQQEEASKAEIKRLKEQFSEQKEKYDKLMSKYEQKANETKQIKQRENDIKERLASAQNSLSELKLKIGDKLNEANQEGNKSVIDILTLISQ